AHVLGLDGHDDQIAERRRLRCRGDRAYLPRRRQAPARRLDGVDRAQIRGAEAFLQQPADDGLRHVAAPDEGDEAHVVHILVLRSWRAPKIAVPTRTIVAPSAMAASRSADMPIESVSSGSPASVSR